MPLPPAWQTRPVTLHLRQQGLAVAAALLLQQTGHGIVIDGEPRYNAVDLDCSGTARQALDKVADAFDYDWRMSKSGLLLLTKRFQNVDERPQMNPAEMRQVAQDISAILNALPFQPNRSLSEGFRALAQTLTPDQRKALENRGRLRIGDMAPHQQELAINAINTKLFDYPARLWKELSRQLTDVSTSCVHIVDSETAYVDAQGTHTRKAMFMGFRPGSRSGNAPPALFYPLPWQPLQHAATASATKNSEMTLPTTPSSVRASSPPTKDEIKARLAVLSIPFENCTDFRLKNAHFFGVFGPSGLGGIGVHPLACLLLGKKRC